MEEITQNSAPNGVKELSPALQRWVEFLSEVLEGERVALWPIDERYYRVYFADFPLARFDSYGLGIERLPKDEPES